MMLPSSARPRLGAPGRAAVARALRWAGAWAPA